MDDAGVPQVRFVSGDVDIGTGDGLMVLDDGSNGGKRVRGQKPSGSAQVGAERRDGRPHGGSQRPFGYEADKTTVRPDEAEVIRAAGRPLRGWGEPAVAVHVAGRRGVPTVTGKRGGTDAARRAAVRAIAGLREHRGEVVGPQCGTRSSARPTATGCSPGWPSRP